MGPRTVRFWWLVALFANASLLPFYASSRADIALMAASGLVIRLCLGRAEIKRSLLVVAVAATLVALVAISAFRTANAYKTDPSISPQEVFGTFVLTRTFADVPTGANIMMAVPGELPYMYGKTVSTWVLAPIPRSVWPDKPVISAGPAIGDAVFDQPQSGVPPGIVAEGYWNFGVVGLLLLPFIGGALLVPLYQRWGPRARESPAAAILLSAIALRSGVDLTSNGLGYAMFQVVSGLALSVPVLWLASHSVEPARFPPLAQAGRWRDALLHTVTDPAVGRPKR